MKRKWRALGIVLALLFLALLGGALYHWRPICPTGRYTATVETPEAGKVSVPVYTMLGRSHWLFIRIPQSHRDPRSWVQCYLLDTTDEAVCLSWMPDSPYLHRNHDQPGGIGILSAKADDHWRIERTDRMVRFTNERQTVTVERARL